MHVGTEINADIADDFRTVHIPHGQAGVFNGLFHAREPAEFFIIVGGRCDGENDFFLHI